MTHPSHWREPCEHCGKRTTCAHYPAYVSGFPARVALAAQCIRTGDGIGSRAFDNCFEMSDGDMVMLMLLRMAESDPVLARGIDREWSKSGGRAGYAPFMARFAHLPDHRIQGAAAEMRKASNQNFELMMQGATQLALI
jgi:hypothetical protein